MASRNLGTLTWDLIAKIGGFESGMDKAARVADQKTRQMSRQAQQRAKEIERAWSNVGKTIAGAFAGFSIASTINKIVTETRNAQNEQAQLAAVLRSTGEAAGFTQDQLNDMADTLSQKSVFSSGDINQAQARLLSYTGIVGKQFPQAMQAAIDMATRLGMDVSSAAETIGRALDVPSQGLTALQRQGFRFTEDQKALVEQLEKTGRTAEAQGIILAALQSAYGGAAEAARNTFGGALSGLQNQLDDLLTGPDGSFQEATNAINGLTATLSSNETKQAFSTFTGLIANMLRVVVESAAVINSTSFFGWLGISGRESGDPAKAIDELTGKLTRLRQEREKLDPSKSVSNKINDFLFGDVADLDRQIAATERSVKALQALQRVRNPQQAQAGNDPAEFYSMDARSGSGLDATGAAAAAKALEEQEKARKKAIQQAQQQVEASEKLITQMKERLALIGLEGEEETLLAKIRAGSVSFATKAQEQTALGLAKEIDQRKKAAEAIKEQQDALDELIKKVDEEDKRRTSRLEQLTGRDVARQMQEDVDLLNQAWSQGELPVAEYERAVRGVLKQTEEVRSETDEFVLQAARNIQTTLGDTLYNVLDGNFKSIGESFADLLKKMAADALAANLAKYLFGDFSKTGNIGGLIGQGISALGSLFGGGRANGGPVSAGSFYEVNERGPELFSSGGRTFLMPGADGFVTPATPSGGIGGMNVEIYNNVGAQVSASMGDDGRLKVMIDERINRLVPGVIESQLSSPSTRAGKQLSRSWKIQPNRN